MTIRTPTLDECSRRWSVRKARSGSELSTQCPNWKAFTVYSRVSSTALLPVNIASISKEYSNVRLDKCLARDTALEDVVPK
ncbi:hypothetical protein SKAU_G00414070 [Synaphobranchus kaupii]|uniref:Uncharacterized protein n=1 Tax=Synaphobranchus kaupii TaxID=118154 RepID=A0A9Q1E710_SYNKA|nr:hypothetical protein SKAU_G00414070 [Synaphobranchus kaupii]